MPILRKAHVAVSNLRVKGEAKIQATFCFRSFLESLSGNGNDDTTHVFNDTHMGC